MKELRELKFTPINIEVSNSRANSKIKLLFLYFRVTNSKSKNKKLHFGLLNRSLKLKRYTSSYLLELEKYLIHFK